MSALAERIKRRKKEIKLLKTKLALRTYFSEGKAQCKWCNHEIMQVDGMWIHIEAKTRHCNPDFDSWVREKNVAEPKNEST